MSVYKYLVLGAAAVFAACQTFFGGSRDDRQAPRPSPREFPEPPPPRRDERQRRQTIDYSQRDYTLVEDLVEDYEPLRARAKAEGDLKAQCSQQSQEAYKRGDGARAKALSEQAKRHAQRVEEFNAKASAIIFKENNKNKAACDIDLHGLYVKEAIAYSEKAIREARQRGDPEVRLIVGQGTHSDGGVSKLKPAIQDNMRKRGLHVEVHPKNPGVLIVQSGSE